MASSSFTEEFTLLGLGLSLVLARTSLRIGTVGLRGLAADDYLMVAASVIYAIATYLAWSVDALYHGLANNAMADGERLAVFEGNPKELFTREKGSKTQIAAQNTYAALLWTLKLAICAYYSRLTHELTGYGVRIKIGYAVVLASWVAAHVTLLAGCVPFSKYWQVYPNPGVRCQAAVSPLIVTTILVPDVASDAYLLSIPLPMLWRAEMPRARKMGLTVLFSGALLVMAMAFLRCIMVVTDLLDGASDSGAWACRESFVAVLTSNAPVAWSAGQVLGRRLKRRIAGGPAFDDIVEVSGMSERGETPTPSWKRRGATTADGGEGS